MRLAPRDFAPALVVAAAIAVAACDASTGGAVAPRASSACTEPGAQCALPAGPLGVCERASCAEGATPPCFACTPQH